MSIYELLESEHQAGTEAYRRKMLHKIPIGLGEVDRVEFILKRCTGKKVLNFGSASGGLHEAIKSVAQSVVGVDRDAPCDIRVDCDSLFVDDSFPAADLIVAGEIIEHLSNPGNFLQELWKFRKPLILTTPNAHSLANSRWLKQKIENVSIDHVAWYSHRTLLTLGERAGFSLIEHAWYNGSPPYSEGLIFVMRPNVQT